MIKTVYIMDLYFGYAIISDVLQTDVFIDNFG